MQTIKKTEHTSIIQTSKLSKSFSIAGNQQHVLKNIDLSIYQGDFTVIMGASGSGKSTLLYALSGMDTPTLGDIYYANENIADYSNDRLALFRRKNCGFVFQQIYLLDNMSVLDNVLSAGLLASRDKKAISKRAAGLLERVGLGKGIFHKFPNQISGGEMQRAGIVRALINNPRILFADEPTGALNSSSSTVVLDVLTELNRCGQSLVVVTHDLKTARRGNRILYLRDGAICGECLLGEYQPKDEQRHQKLTAFLSEMGW